MQALLNKARHHPAAALKRLTAIRWAGRFFARPTGEDEMWAATAKRIRSTRKKRTLKARPLTPAILRDIIDSIRLVKPTHAAILALSWITAGRIADICGLRKRNVMFQFGTDQQEWLVMDLRKSKANPTAAPREDHCSALPLQRIPQWLQHQLREWRSPPKTIRRSIYDMLRKVPPQPTPFISTADKCRPNYSLHSIKMGAAHELLQATATGTLSPRLVSLALKHKQHSTVLAPTTVGYASNPLLVAMTTGITKTTILLATLLFPNKPHRRGTHYPDDSFLPAPRKSLATPRSPPTSVPPSRRRKRSSNLNRE